MSVKVRLTILGFWFGVLALFSFAVAPAAFSVLPSQGLAGAVVSRTLTVVEYTGMVVGLVLLGISAATSRHSKARLAEQLLLALMTLSMVVSYFIVSSRLHSIRSEMGDRLASLPPGDATRMTFDVMHQFSVGLTAFNMAATLILIGTLLWRRSAPRKEVSDRTEPLITP
ncbi:MAG: DUF4149 domain-containing protein [Acidobacteria bacterium]|nr:DUF4149 domain-containing protein [Acidobacteriota bacterium]MCW5967458.1 DUF4149 domain-containing protein [Blastocatellales bacterium]